MIESLSVFVYLTTLRADCPNERVPDEIATDSPLLFQFPQPVICALTGDTNGVSYFFCRRRRILFDRGEIRFLGVDHTIRFLLHVKMVPGLRIYFLLQSKFYVLLLHSK